MGATTAVMFCVIPMRSMKVIISRTGPFGCEERKLFECHREIYSMEHSQIAILCEGNMWRHSDLPTWSQFYFKDSIIEGIFRMIYLEMYGRCGNQMFRYATARVLQLKYYPNEPIVMNFQQVEDKYATDPTFFSVLNDFKVTKYEIYKKKGKPILNESSFIQKIAGALYYIGLKNFKFGMLKRQKR